MKKSSNFLRCLRCVLLYLSMATNYKRHGFTLVASLQCLRRIVFTYLTRIFFLTRFNAFRCALFGLVVVCANYLYFQRLRKFLLVILLVFSLSFCARNTTFCGIHESCKHMDQTAIRNFLLGAGTGN